MLDGKRRLLTALALACILVASVTIAACGGSGGSSEDAQKVINETFSGEKNVDSGKLNLNLTAKIDASGTAATQLKDPVTIKLSGPFQGDPDSNKELPEFDFDLSASAGGQTFTAGAISTGDAGYLSYQGSDYKVDNKTFAQFKKNFEESEAEDEANAGPGLGALGVDPKKWVTNVEFEGTEEVGGADTNHVSADIDVNAFLDDIGNVLKSSEKLNLSPEQEQQLPKEIPDSTKKQIAGSVEEAKIQIWSGKDDDILRKLEVTLKFTIPDSLKTQTQGLEGGTIDLTAEIADVNQPQTINTPTDAKSLSELQSLLQSSPLGALSGSGGSDGTTTTPPSGGAGGTGTGSGSTEDAQKYLECMQNANGDAAASQKCAELLK